MKKFLIAAAVSFMIFGGQTESAQVENFDNQIEAQEQSKWAHFRDKHILGRETENERRDRKEWERRHRYHDDHRYAPPPPPRGHQPPRRGYGYPPPPPHR